MPADENLPPSTARKRSQEDALQLGPRKKGYGRLQNHWFLLFVNLLVLDLNLTPWSLMAATLVEQYMHYATCRRC